MANYKVSDTDLNFVANAIRTKGGTSEGLSFPDGFVTAIGNIQTGGGSTLITKTITENGTYNASSDNADGYSSVTVAVNPKYVTGKFTFTESGANSITIPYTGSGYPIACFIYPSNGSNKSGDDFASLVQNKVEAMYSMIKLDVSTPPTYNDRTASTNKASVASLYKSSNSDPTTMGASGSGSYATYRSDAAGDAWDSLVKFNSNTSMSVYIASTSYGFAKDIEYSYLVIYSS